jgi:hypothetical protein
MGPETEIDYVYHSPHLKMETDPLTETLCFIAIKDYGR